MTKGQARLEINAYVRALGKRFTDEFGIPKYMVKDTGLSIDLVFDDPKVGDISIEYVPKPPYVHNEPDPRDVELLNKLRGLDDRDNW